MGRVAVRKIVVACAHAIALPLLLSACFFVPLPGEIAVATRSGGIVTVGAYFDVRRGGYYYRSPDTGREVPITDAPKINNLGFPEFPTVAEVANEQTKRARDRAALSAALPAAFARDRFPAKRRKRRIPTRTSSVRWCGTAAAPATRAAAGSSLAERLGNPGAGLRGPQRAMS